MKVNKSLVAHEDRPVDVSYAPDRDFINAQKKERAADRDRSSQEAKENERALCSQLMLVTTVLLTANVVVLGNFDLLKSMTYAQKELILLGALSLSLSILAGVKYYFVLMDYYNDWADANNALAHYFGNVQFKTFSEARKKVDQTTKDLKTRADGVWLKTQIGLLAGAFGVYLLLTTALFFDFGFVTRHLPVVMR